MRNSSFRKGSTWGITIGESKLGSFVWAKAVDPGIAHTLYHREFPLTNPLADHIQ